MSLANDFGASKFGLGDDSPCRSHRQRLDDLLPVEAPVFDENLAGVPPANDHARQMDSRHIALKRVRIQRRLAAFRIEPHTQTFYEREIGVVAGQREHASRRQFLLTGSIFDHDFLARDLLDARLEQRFHLAGLDPVLNVRPHPVLDRCTKVLIPVHQRHARSISIEIERRLRGGIFPADHDHVLIPIFVRLGVVMRYVREIFARHAQLIRQIVITCRHGNLLALVFVLRSLLRCRYYCEVSVLAVDPQHPFVQPQFERIVLRWLPVVFQRLDASRLFRRANQRKIANFEQLRRREKHHVHGIMEDRIAKAAFVNNQRPHSGTLGFNGGRQARRPRSNADYVVRFHNDFSLPGVSWNCKLPQHYCFGGRSRSSVSSRRKVSSSLNFSGVASTSFFFQTNTSPKPRFSFTLRFPSTRYDGGASNLIPPFGTGASKAAQLAFLTQRALSYGGIAMGRKPVANSLSITFICCGLSSTMGRSRRGGLPPPFARILGSR